MRKAFIHNIVLVVMGLLLVSCGASGGNLPATSNIDTTTLVYLGAIGAMNDTERRVPVGFYSLQQINNGVGHDYFHVRVLDVWPTSMVNYDLSSNDPNQAAAWMRHVVSLRYSNANLITTLENNWFYESTWYMNDPYAGNPHYISARVFKSTVIDRSMYNPNQPTALQAVLQQRPATAPETKFIAEYLWTYSTSNNTGHIVLDSTTEQTTFGFRQVIREVIFTPAHGTENCVLVQLWDAYYDVNSTTGSVTLTRAYRGAFFAQRTSNQSYIICPEHAPQTATTGAQGTLAVYPE